MRTLGLFLAVSLVSLSLSAQPPMPRKAPEITVVEPSGKQLLLSSFKGKVVALAFVYTTCPHCQAESVVLTKLQNELGDKGFQALGIAFNDNAALLVNQFVQDHHVGFPVGSASYETVANYIQFTGRFVVPQVLLIDRKGMIVAQSEPKNGSPELQEESSLRKKITDRWVPAKTVSKK